MTEYFFFCLDLKSIKGKSSRHSTIRPKRIIHITSSPTLFSNLILAVCSENSIPIITCELAVAFAIDCIR